MAIYQAFTRQSAPNLLNLLATGFVMFIIIYIQDFSVVLYLTPKKVRGGKQPFPVKLFYNSKIPIIL